MTPLKAVAAAFALFAACAITASAQAPAPSGDGRRVALVIGNQTYGALGDLTNPVRDAKAISQSLRESGFATVVEATDLNIADFQRTLREYRRVADGASIALVYFAGHGMEVHGKNYLIPLAANIAKPEDLPLETIPLEIVLTSMGGATTKVLILDACRNNPFERAIRLGAGAPVRSNNQGAGLAPINQAALPHGMLVMYATEPGATASDGLPTDANSPFARALVAELPTRGVDVRLVAGGVTERTMELTGQVQRPFVTALLGRAPVYIAGDGNPQTPAPPPVVTTPVAQTTADAARMLTRAKAAGAAGDCQALLDLIVLLPSGEVATQAQTAAQQCRASYLDRLIVPNRAPVSDAEVRQLAAQNNLEPAALLAAVQVQSVRQGFDANGRPIILFEPHIFSRLTQRRYDDSHPTISYRRWGAVRYPRSQDERWAQLRAAYALDPEAAVASASWGKFQILGMNFRPAGYGSATEFIADVSKSEIAEYRAFLTYAISNNILDELQRLDFTGFARTYNGPGYVQNRYDEQMRAAYLRNGGDASKLPAAPASAESWIDTGRKPMPALRPARATQGASPLFRRITDIDLLTISSKRDAAMAPALVRALNEHLPRAGVNTPLRVAHFLAQASSETQFNELEGSDGNELRTRTDLGNADAEDARKYRPRGIFEIAGRNAYREYGRALGIDLEANPDLMATPDVAVRAALLFWTRGYRGDVPLVELSDRDDIRAISVAVANHDYDVGPREGKLQAAKRAFGIPYTGIEIPNLGEPAPLSPVLPLTLALGVLGIAAWSRRRRA